MGKTKGILWQSGHDWTLMMNRDSEICRYPVSCGSESTSGVTGILECLREQSASPWELALAISACHTLPATVPAGQSALTDRTRQAWTFAVEPQLPWSAEEFVVQTAGKNPQIALAVQVEVWRPLLAGLREAGHQVERIFPAIWLRLVTEISHRDPHGECGFFLRDEDGLHFFKAVNTHVADWRFWPDGPGDVPTFEFVAELAACHPGLRLLTGDASEEVLATCSQQGLTVDSEENRQQPTENRLWSTAWSASLQNLIPNLAVGPLASSQAGEALVRVWRDFLALLILLGCTIAGACWWKSETLREQNANSHQALEQLFRDTFPGTPVPAAIASRFESKHRELRGARLGGDQLALPGPALRGLRSILKAHQAPFRSRFEQVIIQDDVVELEAEFRSHQDAIRMVEALAKTGLTITPPQTENLDDKRVGTRIRGQFHVTEKP